SIGLPNRGCLRRARRERQSVRVAANRFRSARHRHAGNYGRSLATRLARRSALQSAGRKNEVSGNVMSEKTSLFSELKRRNVLKFALVYAVVSWLLIAVASILLPIFEAPGWIMTVLVLFLALGFAFTGFVSWNFEMTPEGMKRTQDVSPGEVIPYWSR